MPASASAAGTADRQGQASRGPRIAVAQELPQQFAPKKHKASASHLAPTKPREHMELSGKQKEI
jgi:hypothetical protein